VGGSFSGVIGQGVNRSYLASVDVDADTGTVTSWNPPEPNEEVNALALSGTTLYVGGNFTKAGASNRAYAAAFDAGSGALRGWNPGPDGVVYALAASSSTVYLGGYFANVDSTPRAGVAAVDTSEGALQAWNPALTQTSGPPNVSAIALEGEEVYLGGDFDAIQGTPPRSHRPGQREHGRGELVEPGSGT
jgi:trimeric autotransporter adhesin